MPNRLAHETSPYLLQHANNPVDWYPWGSEALDRARSEDKPILLSIGYAACHWCHVMEHESFEDDATAALMNERFVSIKVDREERPDLDGIYMQAVQAMTGHGGWPMTVFLTPEGVPFYGGTYFPKNDRPGMPSFTRILQTVSNAYRSKPGDIARAAASVREMYSSATEETRSAGPLTPELLDRAYRAIADRYDERNGGFEGAPKFPQTMSLDFVLRYWARRGVEEALAIVSHSFKQMSRGGIYDQVGGGFARYAVDAVWLVPHFEKPLYCQAQLAALGVDLWRITKDVDFQRVASETIDMVLRDLTSPEGGFFSGLDADSEGVEGKYYVWSYDEVREVLGDGPEADFAIAYWGITPDGNFDGKNILSVGLQMRDGLSRDSSQPAATELLASAKSTLFQRRLQRVPPALDDKVLTSWNSFMLRALASAAQAFSRQDYRDAAIKNGEFLFSTLFRDGRVMRTHRRGVTKGQGFLEDHAGLGLAALSLYELTFDPAWVNKARELAASMVMWFWDDGTGAFYDTASDHETLITRPRDVSDNATPSGTSLAVELLVRTAELFHDLDARRRATYVVETLAPAMTRYPAAFGHLLGSADVLINGAVEVAIIGDPETKPFEALRGAVSKSYVPSLVLAGGNSKASNDIPLLAERIAIDGQATAYLCHSYTCDAPTVSLEEFETQLRNLNARP